MSWLTTVLPEVIAGVASGGTALAWYEMRKARKGTDQTQQKNEEEKELASHISTHVTAHLSPLEERVRAIELTRTDDAVRAVVRAEVSPLASAITSLETKVDVFWKAMAVDVAKILHQPDPRRQHIDTLLEGLMDGTLVPEEREKLRSYLQVIRDWEPGTPADFPIHPGEQVAAAILLSTMDYALDKGGPPHA